MSLSPDSVRDIDVPERLQADDKVSTALQRSEEEFSLSYEFSMQRFNW